MARHEAEGTPTGKTRRKKKRKRSLVETEKTEVSGGD